MNNKTLKKNALYNILRTLATILFPLITFPYVSRILSVENLGKINYGLSIVNYFSLLAALGISVYAVREGAKLKNNRKIFENFVSEVFTINIISTIFSYAILFFCLTYIKQFQNYRILILIQSMVIFFTTIGIDWVNTIYEDFKYIAVRSILIQFCSLLAMLIFVRKSDDYYKYAFINTFITVANNIANLIYCRRYCKLKLVIKKRILKHIKPILIFFANNIAIQIYVSADTTMLGWLVGDYYTGLYSASVKFYSMVKQIFVSFYTVFIPRLALAYTLKKEREYKLLIEKIVNYIILFAVPSMVGMICISKELLVLFCGEKYIYANISLKILSIALLFALFGGIITSCINVTISKEKDNLIATCIAAGLNILLNVLLIPKYKDAGAALTTLFSEAIVVFYCISVNQKQLLKIIDIHNIKLQIKHSILGCVSIVIISIIIHAKIRSEFLIILMVVIIGACTYLMMLFIQKNKCVLEVTAPLFEQIKKIHRK